VQAAEEAELETAGDEPGESTAAAAAAALEALELQSAMRRVPGRAGLAVADAHTGLTAAFAAPKSHMAQFVVAQVRSTKFVLRSILSRSLIYQGGGATAGAACGPARGGRRPACSGDKSGDGGGEGGARRSAAAAARAGGHGLRA
jgi:hypothetical protein